MRLTKAEQETIVVFNKADPLAEVFTYEKAWQNHIEQKLKIKPISKTRENGRTYEIPKNLISPPRKPRGV